MSKIEKIIIIVLALSALGGVGISYYKKCSGEKIEITAAALTEKIDQAQKTISERKIININSADKETLTKLPGIGPALAENIIDYRRRFKRFDSAEDIMKVKGIGQKKYQALKDFICIDE
jgi:comEA protein